MPSNDLPTEAHSLPVAQPTGASLGHPAARGVVLEDEPAGDWRRYTAALVRYRWAVLGVTILGAGAGFAVSRLIPPKYRAQATVWIEQDDQRRGGNRGPIREDPMLAPTAWTELLRSYVVLDEVVRETRRYLSFKSSADASAFAKFSLGQRFRPGWYRLEIAKDGKTFTLHTHEGVIAQRGAVGDSVGASLGFQWLPSPGALRPGRTTQFRVVPPRDAALELAKQLQIQTDQLGNFLRIELEGTEPAPTAATLNSLTHHYVEIAGDLKRKKLTELTTILSEQLAAGEKHLRDAESALENFRVRTITLPSERSTPVAPGLEVTRDPVLSSYFDIKIEREQLRRDREAIERAVASATPDSGVSPGSLSFLSSVQRSVELTQALQELTNKQAELRAMLYRYTDDHPPAQDLRLQVKTLEHVTIPKLARALAGQVREREAELDRRIASASIDLRTIPTRAIEEARLRRDVAVAENLYTALQQRYEEARLAAASTIPDVRILDDAVVPEEPSKDTAPRVILLALLGSLGLGVVGAVLLDRVDPRFRYPEQVRVGLGLRILGSVPRVPKPGRGGAGGTAPVVEALRGIRLGIQHAYGAAGPCLVTVSSPGAGDGKSFVAANLAMTFAEAGHDTLLIDGDLRRGTLHHLVEAERKPGLTDYLAGSVGADRIIQPTAHASLRFIGCGTWMQQAPELLGSSAMTQLLVRLKSSFSFIIVDSPPLGAGVDPFVLGTATGSMLLVLRTGVTDRELTAAQLDVIDTLPIRVLGAVLNDVRPEGAYRYYAYTPGYEVTDEGSARVGTRQLRKGGKS